MQVYRAYRLDKAGHIVGPPMVISCDDDGEAIEDAKQLVDDIYNIEVWQLARLVIHLPSHDKS